MSEDLTEKYIKLLEERQEFFDFMSSLETLRRSVIDDRDRRKTQVQNNKQLYKKLMWVPCHYCLCIGTLLIVLDQEDGYFVHCTRCESQEDAEKNPQGAVNEYVKKARLAHNERGNSAY